MLSRYMSYPIKGICEGVFSKIAQHLVVDLEGSEIC